METNRPLETDQAASGSRTPPSTAPGWCLLCHVFTTLPSQTRGTSIVPAAHRSLLQLHLSLRHYSHLLLYCWFVITRGTISIRVIPLLFITQGSADNYYLWITIRPFPHSSEDEIKFSFCFSFHIRNLRNTIVCIFRDLILHFNLVHL